MATARRLVGKHQYGGHLTLRSWRGGWMRWKSSHWAEIEDAEIRSWAYQQVEHADYLDEEGKQKAWSPTRYKVANMLEALGAVTHLPESVNPPAWIADADVPAGELVACTNGLLHVGSRKLLEHTPAFFNVVSVPFAHREDAPEPTRWLRFLAQLWPDDPESIAALQEWFGYVLSGRTDLHKILLLIGPIRAGKGTIARVLVELIGKGNEAGPTLASLATNFGLSPLLGKPLALVSDARLGGAGVHQVVERLLSISGEDTLTVDRKYREPWTGKLPTRFMILSNELPRFGDASGAISSRFIVLALRESFYGRENTHLTGELLGELPGILNWALDGLDRLGAFGKLTVPASSSDAIAALQDLVSPTSAFVRDHCTTSAEASVRIDVLYAAWKIWCEDNGRRPGSVQSFGRDLRAVLPSIRVSRPELPDGTRYRSYDGIALISTHNANDRGHRGRSEGPRPESTRMPGSPSATSATEPIVDLLPGATSATDPSPSHSISGPAIEGEADPPTCPTCGTEVWSDGLCVVCEAQPKAKATCQTHPGREPLPDGLCPGCATDDPVYPKATAAWL
ncbi:MAG: NTP-binding protein [Geodermatophilaceae bacterium]|nr:NTP-binding protein [Geodermatophilaceae bacterium]